MPLVRRLCFAAAVCTLAAPLPAGAALITHKDLTLSIAKTIAEGAVAACAAKGCGAATKPRRIRWRMRGARPTRR